MHLTEHPPFERPLLCDTEETQRLIPVSRTTLWKLVKEGRLATVNVGRRRFFTYASIEKFVTEQSANERGAQPL